jgi:hypothetical protein
MKLLSSIIICACAFSGMGQNAALDQLYTSVPSASSQQMAQSKLALFVNAQNIKKQSKRSEAKFIGRLVKNVHSEFLRVYKPYVQINEPFENGNYDCLTGTAIFSLILTELGIEHQIIETNYHIFLMIDGKTQKYLLETTDKLFGLKTRSSEIDAALNDYKKNNINPTMAGTQHYSFKGDLFHKVLPAQLKGLLHFNQAVVAFNTHNLSICIDQLELAKKSYNNTRIRELAELVASAIAFSTLSEKEKYSLFIKLTNFENSTSVAAR